MGAYIITTTSTRKNVIALMALAIFSFMTSLDSSIVNIAMPVIAKEQNQSVNNIEWIVIIYLLVITSLLMFFGKLGDLVGKIKVFKIGTVIFVIGSIMAGSGSNFIFLLISRGIQALGAAMTMSNNFGITTALFPKEQRGRAMSILATAFALGSIAGPSFGGIILSVASWRYIFWINVPIGIVAVWFGHIALPKSAKRYESINLDYWGTILFASFISLLFYGFSQGQNIGYSSLPVLIELFTSVVLLIMFLIHERNTKTPMLDLEIFKNKEFSMGVFSAVLVFIVGYFYNIIIPYYLVSARHFDPGFAGLLMATIPLTIAFFGPIGGILADKFGGAKIAIIGLGALIIAQVMILNFKLDTVLSIFILTSVMYGIGMGLFQSPNNSVIMSSVPKKELGIAGSINALARNLGMMIGTSLSTFILFTTMSLRTGEHVAKYPIEQDRLFVFGMKYTFIIATIVTVIAEIITVYRFISIKKFQHEN